MAPLTRRDRFRGCLLGGAVGDALGAPVEFLRRAEILERFGPEGITIYASADGGIGRITDDTQMTLFTAEGILRGRVRWCHRGMASRAVVVNRAYLRWLHTQGERPAGKIELYDGWLLTHPELHSRRAPGDTCLAALGAKRSPGEPAANNSKGCGGVMRMAPAGLFGDPDGAFGAGMELAALTHGHPTGAAAAGALAALVAWLAGGAPLPDALAAVKDRLRTPSGEETLRAIETAERQAIDGGPPAAAIADIGEGWIAEEALAIALYCALAARDFRHGVTLAVNHDGDSDSTGAIAGNLLGVMHGAGAIPPEWLEPLELRDVIAGIADDLHDIPDWDIGEYSQNEELNKQVWEKYPGV